MDIENHLFIFLFKYNDHKMYFLYSSVSLYIRVHDGFILMTKGNEVIYVLRVTGLSIGYRISSGLGTVEDKFIAKLKY